MIVGELSDLLLYPVENRGVPNAERIPIHVRQRVDMGQFGVMVGPIVQPGFAMPARDNLFWFGDGIVNPGDWILLYTGSGQPRADSWNDPPGSKIYVVHWGRSTTMFADSNVVPLLFSVAGAQVGTPRSDVPQLSVSSS